MKYYISCLFLLGSCFLSGQVLNNIFGEVYSVGLLDEDGFGFPKEYMKQEFVYLNGFGFGTEISKKHSLLLRFNRIDKELTTIIGFVYEKSKHSGVGIGVEGIYDFLQVKKSVFSIRYGIEYQKLEIDYMYFDDSGHSAMYDFSNKNILFSIQLGYRIKISDLFSVGVILRNNRGGELFKGKVERSDMFLFNVQLNKWKWFDRNSSAAIVFLRLTIK